MRQRALATLLVLVVACAAAPAARAVNVWDADLTGVKVLAVIPPTRFNEWELAAIEGTLKQLKAEVLVVSSTTDSVRGNRKLRTITPTKRLDEVDAADFDVVFFLSGPGATKEFFQDDKATRLAAAAMAADKVVAASSTAPLLLANAGLLKGRKVTCHPSVKDQVVAAGAEWVDDTVVEDGRLLTCPTPEAAKRLCRFIVYLLRPDFRE